MASEKGDDMTDRTEWEVLKAAKQQAELPLISDKIIGGASMKFRVTLTAQASISTAVEVEAIDREEAREKAIDEARAGNVIWKYDGCDDESIEVDATERR